MTRTVTCTCGGTFEARHPRARYCSDRCRKRGQRAPTAKVVALPGAETQVDRPEAGAAAGPIEAATIDELTRASRHTTPLGLVVVALARRLDNGQRETGSAYSALAARFEAQRAAAMRGVSTATAPSALNDEVAARRAARAGA